MKKKSEKQQRDQKKISASHLPIAIKPLIGGKSSRLSHHDAVAVLEPISMLEQLR